MSERCACHPIISAKLKEEGTQYNSCTAENKSFIRVDKIRSHPICCLSALWVHYKHNLIIQRWNKMFQSTEELSSDTWWTRINIPIKKNNHFAYNLMLGLMWFNHFCINHNELHQITSHAGVYPRDVNTILDRWSVYHGTCTQTAWIYSIFTLCWIRPPVM